MMDNLDLFLRWTFLPDVHGGHDSGGGVVSLLDDFLALLSGDSGFGKGSSPFGGLALLGSNIHPMLVHFPIAFLTIYFLLDLTGYTLNLPKIRRLGSHLLTLGFLGCLPTVASGLFAAATVAHDANAHSIMVWHQRFGLTILSLSMILVIWRWTLGIPADPMKNSLNQLLNVLLLAALLAGADLGASLVYGHGVAVHPTEKGSTNTHQHGESPEDSPHSH